MNQLKPHIGSLLLACILSSATSTAAQAPDEASGPPSPSAEPSTSLAGQAEAGSAPAPSTDVAKQAPSAIRAELLDELFREAAEGSKTTRQYTGLAGVLGGSILVGLAGWRLAQDPAESEYSRGLGVMFATLGMVDLTTGIIALKREPQEEERARRYAKDLEEGISSVELARYEGELRAGAHIREVQRMLVRWNGLTHALAGAIVMGFSAIPDLDTKSRRSAYIIGGVFMGTGSASFGLSFRETPNERAWKKYQEATRELPELGQQVQVGPVFSRHSLGLGVSGRF